MDALLERALCDLDRSTDDLLQADLEDAEAMCKALERRADAITKVAFLIEDHSGRNEATRDRLSAALARGEQAVRRVLDIKQDTTVEWARLRQILRGYSTGAAEDARTDLSA